VLPTGGAALARPAGIFNFRFAFTAFAIVIRSPFEQQD
jgi:hypothetical protein